MRLNGDEKKERQTKAGQGEAREEGKNAGSNDFIDSLPCSLVSPPLPPFPLLSGGLYPIQALKDHGL